MRVSVDTTDPVTILTGTEGMLSSHTEGRKGCSICDSCLLPMSTAGAAGTSFERGGKRQGATHLWVEVLVAAVQGHKQHTVVLPEHLLGAVAMVYLRIGSTAEAAAAEQCCSATEPSEARNGGLECPQGMARGA